MKLISPTTPKPFKYWIPTQSSWNGKRNAAGRRILQVNVFCGYTALLPTACSHLCLGLPEPLRRQSRCP